MHISRRLDYIRMCGKCYGLYMGKSCRDCKAPSSFRYWTHPCLEAPPKIRVAISTVDMMDV